MNWNRIYLAARNNLGLKLLAILVALLLWVYVSVIQVSPPGRTAEETQFPWRE